MLCGQTIYSCILQIPTCTTEIKNWAPLIHHTNEQNYNSVTTACIAAFTENNRFKVEKQHIQTFSTKSPFHTLTHGRGIKYRVCRMEDDTSGYCPQRVNGRRWVGGSQLELCDLDQSLSLPEPQLPPSAGIRMSAPGQGLPELRWCAQVNNALCYLRRTVGNLPLTTLPGGSGQRQWRQLWE